MNPSFPPSCYENSGFLPTIVSFLFLEKHSRELGRMISLRTNDDTHSVSFLLVFAKVHFVSFSLSFFLQHLFYKRQRSCHLYGITDTEKV